MARPDHSCAHGHDQRIMRIFVAHMFAKSKMAFDFTEAPGTGACVTAINNPETVTYVGPCVNGVAVIRQKRNASCTPSMKSPLGGNLQHPLPVVR
jgi:hypothetical protein